MVDQPANNQTRTWPTDDPHQGLEMKGQPASQQSNKNMSDRPTQHYGPEALRDGLGTIWPESQNLLQDLDQFLH